MALVHKDHVKETSTTTGTVAYALAGAVSGFQSFAAIGNGNTCYYSAGDGVNWESGVGTYSTTGPTLTRTLVLESSNGGAAVNWGAGTKTIVCTPIAAKFKGADDLGGAALLNVGTTAGTVAAGDDSRITGAIQSSLLTTRGDLIARGASAAQRLALGAANTVLASDGTDSVWASVVYAMLASSAYIGSGDFRAATASKLLNSAGVWNDAAFVTLTDATTITVDMSTFLTCASVQLGGNRTLGNPSNVKAGQFFAIKVTATGSTRTLALGANYTAAIGVEAFPISVATTDNVYVCGFMEDSTHARITAVLRF